MSSTNITYGLSASRIFFIDVTNKNFIEKSPILFDYENNIIITQEAQDESISSDLSFIIPKRHS